MYTGSMMGAGLDKFGVMNYAISTQKPFPVGNNEIEMRVELNPKYLAVVLGSDEETMKGAIEWLCSPDERSRTKKAEGRRLVRLGQFEYLVVNGWEYTARNDLDRRREQLRRAARRYREKKKNQALPTKQRSYDSAERAFIEEGGNGASQEDLDRIVDQSNPQQ